MGKKKPDSPQLKLADEDARLQGTITKNLYIAGDLIAKRLKYRNLEGIEAAQYYLVQKHNWTPSQVRAMSREDLLFCLSEDENSTAL